MEERTPFANVLHAEIVERLARGAALERGKAYATAGRVRAIAKLEGRLVASVRGGARTPYAVSIWVKGDGLGYVCSCPAGAEGDFCKHCVAVAIAWLARQV